LFANVFTRLGSRDARRKTTSASSCAQACTRGRCPGFGETDLFAKKASAEIKIKGRIHENAYRLRPQ